MGTDRQLHSVENRNRRLRVGGARTILLDAPGDMEHYTEIADRATVIPVRPIEYVVKHRKDDVEYNFERNDDPVNILGPVIENMIPIVTNNDPESMQAAFNKRCNTLKDKPEHKMGKAELKAALKLIDSLPRGHFDAWEENDLDRSRWLAKFDEPKRKRMEDAWSTMYDATKRDIRNKTLMVKVESLLKRTEDERGKWAPRAIYVGSDAHNALTGPAMMVAMERLVEILDTDNGGVKLGPADIRFAYKKDDIYLMEHLTRESTCHVVVEGDYSANDKEQVREVGDDLIDRLLWVLGFDDFTRKWMLESNEEFDVYALVLGLKAKLKYQLPTGTTATTFRNSAFNALQFAVSMQQQKIHHCRAIILGDDLLAVLQGKISIQEWQNTVKRFQMVLKGMEHPEFNGLATFLSRRVINIGTPCLVPKIGKMLARFNVRACKNPAVTDDVYMMGKSYAHAYECRRVPALANLFLERAEYHERLVDEAKAKGDLQHDSWFLKISGLTTAAQIRNAIVTSPVKLSELDFTDWVADTYLIGWCDLRELCEQIILGTRYKVIETALFDDLAIDF